MRNRPWPVVVLAFIQFLSPIPNILVSSMMMEMSPVAFVPMVFQHADWYQLMDFFLVPPLAGIAIYAFRGWSYALFLVITAWNILYNLNTWYENPETVSLWVMLGAHAVNFGLVSYFLLPAVRAAYFKPELRWWETAARYFVDITATLQGGEGENKVKITDISKGGAFVRTSIKFEADENISLHFNFMNVDLTVEARVVHQRWEGYGLQFILNPTSEVQLDKVIKVLKVMNYPQRAPRGNFVQGLKDWFFKFVTTGEGLVPQAQPTSKKSDTGTEKKQDSDAA